MDTSTRALGADYEFPDSLIGDAIRKVGGYKRDKLIAIFSQLCRPENGGSIDACLTLKETNKVVGRCIHIAGLAIRLEGFNAWRMLKKRLNDNHVSYLQQRELASTSKKPVSFKGLQQWKWGIQIRAGDELRWESERLLRYVHLLTVSDLSNDVLTDVTYELCSFHSTEEARRGEDSTPSR